MRRLSFAEQIEPGDTSNALKLYSQDAWFKYPPGHQLPDEEISWFFLFSPSRFPDSTPSRLQLLPNHFHFTNHLTIQCSIVCVQTTLESKQPRNKL